MYLHAPFTHMKFKLHALFKLPFTHCFMLPSSIPSTLPPIPPHMLEAPFARASA